MTSRSGARANRVIVGVPKETKADEYRVALLPVGAELLVNDGHRVLVEAGAGARSGFSDEAYTSAGAEVDDGTDPLFAAAELIAKVKQPQPAELAKLQPRR